MSTILQGTPRDVRRDAAARIAVAGPGGYVLSTACSVSPASPPDNIAQLRAAADEAADIGAASRARRAAPFRP